MINPQFLFKKGWVVLHKKRIRNRDYYYTTIRENSGKTKTIYLGSNKRSAIKKEKSLGLTHKPNHSFFYTFLSVLAFFLLVGTVGFSFTGFVVEDVTVSSSESLDNPQSLQLEDPEEEKIEEETSEEEVVEEEPPTEETIEEKPNEDVINETEIIIEEEPQLNETIEEINETEIEINQTIINETIEEPELFLNETESNTTILNETNLTPEKINKTEITLTNQTFEPNKNITELYYEVVINQPVKWEKKVNLEKEVASLQIKIPKTADNITITKVGNEIQKVEKEQNKITGNYIFNLITGFVTGESKSEEQTLDIDGPLTGAVVEYYMPGPKAKEIEISNWKKQIIVSSEEHYENILTYTKINNFPEDSIKLYEFNNKTREEVAFFPHDKDEDGNIDYIEWITPSLSEKVYEIEITILNVQSYPTVGGNWTVFFNTTGKDDLQIKGVNDTYFDIDLNFLEVKCGETPVPFTYSNNTIYIQDYECNNQTGMEISKVLTPGKHHLEFKFGEAVAYAHNLATISNCQTLDTDNEYYVLDSDIDNDDGTCFTVSGSNITLDCQGHYIDGDADASGYGVIINNANYDNLTITNCTIQQFARNVSGGVQG